MNKHRMVGVILLLLTVSLFPLSTIQQPPQTNTARFVFAGYTFPSDEYGQGIDKIEVYDNSSGSWIPMETLEYDEDSSIDFNASDIDTIRLNVWAWQNLSLTNASDWIEGMNYHRHDVTLRSNNGPILFSQQNFTYASAFPAIDPPLCYYEYEVLISGFTPIDGEIYTFTIGYDVYYQLEGSYYLNDGSDLSEISLSSVGGLAVGEYGIRSSGGVIESWIMPDDSGDENSIYTYNFTNIDNTANIQMNVSIRYKIDSTTSFSYLVVYNDTTYDTSTLGLSTSYTTLTVTCDSKFLDYIQLYNSDFPNSVATGDLSVWIDYIQVSRTYMQWTQTAEVRIYLHALYNMWGFNGALIILGLMMIPAGGVYLVWGGRKELNQDKLFFALIVFCMGWGLLIGGIIP